MLLYGPAGTVNGNQYVVTGLSPGDSVSIQLTVSGNTICPPVVIEASCVAQDCPTPVIDIDPVDDICLYPGTGTVDLHVSVTNGSGSGVWSGTGVTDAVQGTFDPNLAGPGAHHIAYQYTDSGCSFIDSITINVFDPPTAVISNVTFTLTCENNSELVLDGTNSTGQGQLTYAWSTPDGLIIGPANQATATAGAKGEYFLTVTDPVSLCKDETGVTLVEDTGMPVADAGPDGLINCDTALAVLGGSSSSGPDITYVWGSPDGGTIDSDPTAASITVSAGGTYILTVTDNNNGCTAVDQASVVMDVARPTAMLSVSGILDCDTKNVTITSDVNPSGINYTYAWQTFDGRIVSGDGTPSVVADRVGLYTLYVTRGDNGCMDTVSIEVMSDPAAISGINALVDNPNCVGDNDGMIQINALIGGTPPYTYAWSNHNSGPGLLFLSPGTYSVTVTDANGCSFEESYTLPAPIPENPEIGADLTVDYGEAVTITLSVTDPGAIAEITWGGVAPSCPACFENTFTAEISGSVSVTVIDTNGCTSTAVLHLKVDISRNVYIPNVFSPNGDGINDIFRIQGKILDRIDYLRIFDRWGDLVYEQLPALAGDVKGWDGTYKGKPLDPGVFVYTAKLIYADGLERVVSGSVTLVR